MKQNIIAQNTKGQWSSWGLNLVSLSERKMQVRKGISKENSSTGNKPGCVWQLTGGVSTMVAKHSYAALWSHSDP